MKKLLCLALAVSLSACATTGTMSDRLAAADPVIAQIQSRYEQAQGWAAWFLPYLSPERQRLVEMAGAAVEAALQAARTATTLAAQQAALKNAQSAVDQLDRVAGN